MSLHSQIDSHKIHEGYLYKQGYWNTSWKKRYFVLYNDRTVDYFKDKSDSSSRNKAKGTIYLTQIRRVELVKSTKDNDKNNKINSPQSRNISNNHPSSFIFHDPNSTQHESMGDIPITSLSAKQSISINSDNHTLSDEVPFLKASPLKSISEKDETTEHSNRGITRSVNNVYLPSNNMDIVMGVNGVNGVHLDIDYGGYGVSTTHPSVISSYQPPPDYSEIIETEKQFEKEREMMTKSLLDLKQTNTTNVSPRNNNDVRPPTPCNGQQRKKKRATSTYTFTESEIGTYLTEHNKKKRRTKDNIPNHKM